MKDSRPGPTMNNCHLHHRLLCEPTPLYKHPGSPGCKKLAWDMDKGKELDMGLDMGMDTGMDIRIRTHRSNPHNEPRHQS